MKKENINKAHKALKTLSSNGKARATSIKKKYIIVGDNNFWYGTTHEITEKELQVELKYYKKAIKRGDFMDSIDKEPTELLAYEATITKFRLAI